MKWCRRREKGASLVAPGAGRRCTAGTTWGVIASGGEMIVPCHPFTTPRAGSQSAVGYLDCLISSFVLRAAPAGTVFSRREVTDITHHFCYLKISETFIYQIKQNNITKSFGKFFLEEEKRKNSEIKAGKKYRHQQENIWASVQFVPRFIPRLSNRLCFSISIPTTRLIEAIQSGESSLWLYRNETRPIFVILFMALLRKWEIST